MKLKALLLGLLAVSLAACSPKLQNEASDSTQELLQYMTGSFDSSEQAEQDSAYYNISLHMYPIWQDREGHYLYVEQALATMQDKPYRQRIYKVEPLGQGKYVSWVYTIPNEKDFIGAYDKPQAWNDLLPSQLEIREGCEVYLHKQGNSYTGKTKDKTCGSTLRGASFASSVVTITSSGIESWDQGWDDSGKQVWGATKGGYIFKKLP